MGETVEFKLTGSDGKVLDARRDAPGDAWRLVSPASTAADAAAVDDLVFTAESISPTTTVKSPPQRPVLMTWCSSCTGYLPRTRISFASTRRGDSLLA